jgi:UDP-N-acetyl-D-mannosaminuronate dehydrogenase
MPHPTDTLLDDLRSRRTAIAVIGLGYVGLPLAL